MSPAKEKRRVRLVGALLQGMVILCLVLEDQTSLQYIL